jgi:sugar phosphate isomerase/epimerase
MGLINVAPRVAVCSWSLQPSTPAELVSKLTQTGVSRIQLALDPLRENPSVWGDAPAMLQAQGLKVISGMFGCVGEDYSTLETIKATGGVAPDSTWTQNLENARATARIAAGLGLTLVTFHAGFLPHDHHDPVFRRLLERLRSVADIFDAAGLLLGLETGQETAQALAGMLQELGRPNVCVNFDPANMILYDKGDPVEAVATLSPWIRQVHIKDAKRTKVPGTWGEEVPVGTGDVSWTEFFDVLNTKGYGGDLVIEREAGQQRAADIRTAHQFLKSL